MLKKIEDDRALYYLRLPFKVQFHLSFSSSGIHGHLRRSLRLK